MLKVASKVTAKSDELTSDDYAYRFPDHWIDHEFKAGGTFTRMHSAYAERVVKIIKKSGAQTVLEVGCGDGWICGKMVEAGLDTAGVDWSANAIRYSEIFVPRAKFHCGDVRDAEFLRRFPNKFDAVALVEVIEHIPPRDCVSAIENVIGPLKSGGLFVLTTPSVNLPNTSTLHYRHFTKEILLKLVTDAGLVVKSIEGYGDVSATNSYWAKMRWVENRYYTIKPIVKLLTDAFHRHTNLINTPLDRCAGFVVTMAKL